MGWNNEPSSSAEAAVKIDIRFNLEGKNQAGRYIW
jgi:hypothetical protein